MAETKANGQARTVKVTAAITLVTGAVLWRLVGWGAALGYVGGVITGLGMLASLVLCANRLVVPVEEQRGPRWPYLLLHLGKFAGAIALAWLLVGVLEASVAAFAAGYATSLTGFLVYVNAGWRGTRAKG